MGRRQYKEYGRCNIHRSKKNRNPSRKKEENREEAWGNLACVLRSLPRPKPTMLKVLNPFPGDSEDPGTRSAVRCEAVCPTTKKAQSHAGRALSSHSHMPTILLVSAENWPRGGCSLGAPQHGFTESASVVPGPEFGSAIGELCVML